MWLDELLRDTGSCQTHSTQPSQAAELSDTLPCYPLRPTTLHSSCIWENASKARQLLLRLITSITTLTKLPIICYSGTILNTGSLWLLWTFRFSSWKHITMISRTLCIGFIAFGCHFIFQSKLYMKSPETVLWTLIKFWRYNTKMYAPARTTLPYWS